MQDNNSDALPLASTTNNKLYKKKTLFKNGKNKRGKGAPLTILFGSDILSHCTGAGSEETRRTFKSFY